MVVDNNPDILANLTTILRSAHYRVITAADGHTAVQMAYEAKPDLIFCGITIPDLDGFDVFRLLSKYLNVSVTPFIFIAKPDRKTQGKGVSIGADDDLMKPFDGDELLSVIEIGLQKSIAGRKAKIDLEMADMDFFHQEENPDFQKLIENRVARTYMNKEVVYREGDSSDHMYYIRSGKIKTYKSNHLGKELITGIHKEGDCFGYVSLIGNAPYTESAVALTDAELLPIPKQDFLSALYASRELARNFIVLLSHNVHEVQNRLVELAYQSVRQKVVAALLRMYEYGLSSGESAIISVTREDLSNLAGTAPESLNRALYALRDEGLIDFIDDGIRLLDKSALTDFLRHSED